MMKFEFCAVFHRVAVGFPLAGEMGSATVSELEIRVAFRRAGKALVNMTVVRRLEKKCEEAREISHPQFFMKYTNYSKEKSYSTYC